jgi:hypothetical protein
MENSICILCVISVSFFGFGSKRMIEREASFPPKFWSHCVVWYDRPSKFSYLPHSFFSLSRVCNIFVQTFLNIYTRILKCWSHFWDNFIMFEKIIVIKFSIGTQARKGFFQNLKAKFSTKVVNVRNTSIVKLYLNCKQNSNPRISLYLKLYTHKWNFV